MSIVMGVDQHRAQITAEWIDLVSGEINRARVRPADRAGVRRFLERFAGQQLEVALEATTGWRFFVEELRAVGAVVHLAEPAETAARRGNKQRAKTDRADARHHRELLLAGRLPESWIPPDHILDLRALVRLRHTLIEQHSEWQQRIQAVLYHHGCPQRRQLMKSEGRDWLGALALPETARQQITVSLAMTDALDAQLEPLSRQLRCYARGQTGCKALISKHYGSGRCAPSRSSPSSVTAGGLTTAVTRSVTAGWTSPSTNPIAIARLGVSAARGRRRCAGRYTRPPTPLGALAHPTARTTSRQPSDWAATAPVWRSRASCSSAAITRSASSAKTPSRHPPTNGIAEPRAARQAAVVEGPSVQRPASRQMLWPLDPGFGSAVQQRVPARRPAHPTTSFPPKQIADARQALTHTDAPRPAPSLLLPTRSRGRPRKIERPQRFPPAGSPHRTSCRRPAAQQGSWTKVRLGARAHTDPVERAHAPPHATTLHA